MLRYILSFLLLFQFTGGSAQTPVSMKFNELEKQIRGTKDKVIVVNFWATWCKPCIEELPYFEKLHETYSGKNVEVILANLDFNSKVTSLVEPFIKRKNIRSTVIHISDTDPNEWINKIDSTWSGAIPATVIYDPSGKKILFHEGQMTFEELEKAIQPFINQ